MDFIYDNNGKPYALVYDGTTYYYILNLQGDVIAIVDGSGTTMAQYAYDAWGKAVLATGSLSGINPIRYRGYYYDAESGLYYLQSRYYDPVVKRFVNADSTNTITSYSCLLGSNLFAYSHNCPTMYSDNDGNWPKLSTVLMTTAIVATSVALAAAVVATGGLALGALAGGGSILVSTSVSVAATGAAVAAGKTAIVAGTAAVAAKAAEDAVERYRSRTHTVYKLVDDDGVTQYVGRTVNYAARCAAHANDPTKAGLHPVIIKSGLTYSQARGLEQIAMIHYNTRSYRNKINGISSRNKRLASYMAAGRQVAHYLGNYVSNEALYWSGR